MTMKTDYVEPYPDEVLALHETLTKIQNAFLGKTFDRQTRHDFELSVVDKIADLGFVAVVDWDIMEAPDGNSYYLPAVDVVRRIVPEPETDFDRVQWGVRKGLEDGQPGYIRADGSHHEEPIKKTIL